MSALAVVITDAQQERLEALCESSGFSPDAQIGALIDLDFEEWQDSLAPDAQSKSTRFARFVASIVGSALLVAFAGCVAQPKHTACATDAVTQRAASSLPICVGKKGGAK